MKTGVAQSHVNAMPGQATRVDVDITNTADVIDGITAIVDGINPDWVRLERPMISLFPQATERLTIVFDIPGHCPAGDYLVVVHIVSTIDAERAAVHDFWLTVGEIEGVDVELRPTIVSGGRSATIEATVVNTGNATAEVTVAALEPTRAVDCRVEPNRILLGHGTEALLPIELRGSRPWFGQPAVRQIHVTVSSGEETVEKIATFRQRPRIARGLITALILAAIVALWALIFLWVISELRADEPGAKAIGTDIFTGPANIPIAEVGGTAIGRVRAASSGDGIARITVEATRVTADGEEVPAGSAATDETGAFELPSLVPGDYRLRFSADGYDEVTYHGDDAELVTIGPRETVDGLDVELTGQAGQITGRIDLPPGSGSVPLTVTATMLTERSPADANADTTNADDDTDPNGTGTGSGTDDAASSPAPTFTQETTDGTISLDGLPTPADYQVTISGPGFDTHSFRQTVDGGQSSVVDTVSLGAAEGSITAIVTDGTGQPLGGVEVVARSGDIERRAASSTGATPGEFSLVGLPTPNTYVLSFELDGYTGPTLALDLPAGGSESVAATMIGGSGTISGAAVATDGTPLGGVAVSVVGEGYSASTTTLTSSGSGGAAGSFTLTDLPVPNDYTITFGADRYQAETLAISLSNAGEQALGTVALLPLDAKVTGTVHSNGVGIGEAIVTLTNGTESQATTSATNPAGAYTFAGVDPGSYTLTVERGGFASRVELVEVPAGDTVVHDLPIIASGR